VLKDKERERENKLAALGEKEQNLSAVENEMKKKLENAHGNLLLLKFGMLTLFTVFIYLFIYLFKL